MGRFYIPPRGIIDPRVVPTRPVEVIPEARAALSLICLCVPGIAFLDILGNSTPLTLIGTANSIHGSPMGPGYASTGNGAVLSVVPGAALQIQPPLTLFWYGFQLGAPLGGAEVGTLIGVDLNHTQTSPYYSYNMQLVGAAGGSSNGLWFADATAGYPSNSPIPTSGLHSYVASWTGTSVALYQDGVLLNTVATAAETVTYSTPTLDIGGDLYGGGRSSNTVSLVAGIASAAWTSGQVARFVAEPFAMLRERAPPILYSFASGGGGTLVGTAAATSTATGTLVGTGTLTGTAAAASTATATLAGAGLLTGTAAATSTATGTLAGAGALTGTAAATSTATGILSSGAYLVGTAAATSTATGTLAGAGALTGTAAATSAATATLAGSGALTGTSAATSTATGTLTTATSLVGRADATSTATGTLAGAGRMTGTAAATSTAPAFLIGFGPISGIAAATSTATGTLASRSWVFRAGRIVSIPTDIRTAAIPADIRTVQ